MTFPAGPILPTAAPHREHCTPSAVYGASANGDGEQVGSAGNIIAFVSGYSRAVILASGYAIKLPRITGGWRAFVSGILSNMLEAERWRASQDPALCPVLWSWAGLVLIQPRVRITQDVPAVNVAGYDHKPGSYGWLDGRLVAVDYHGGVL